LGNYKISGIGGIDMFGASVKNYKLLVYDLYNQTQRLNSK